MFCKTELYLFVHSSLTNGNVSCMWDVLVLNHGWDTNYLEWSKIWGFASVDVAASFGMSEINNHTTGLNNSEALNPHGDWSLSWFISVPSFQYLWNSCAFHCCNSSTCLHFVICDGERHVNILEGLFIVLCERMMWKYCGHVLIQHLSDAHFVDL